MNNQADDVRDINAETGVHPNKLTLPLVALGLDLLPVLLGFLGSFGISVPMYSLFVILSPTVGLITGIAALNQGKARIGLTGKIIAVIAVALPLAFVALIVVFFIGAVTGMISLM